VLVPSRNVSALHGRASAGEAIDIPLPSGDISLSEAGLGGGATAWVMRGTYVTSARTSPSDASSPGPGLELVPSGGFVWLDSGSVLLPFYEKN